LPLISTLGFPQWNYPIMRWANGRSTTFWNTLTIKVILIPFNTSSNVPILNGLLSKAPRKLGRSIPHDVAVVSFDNQELIAAHLHPPLSTLELPTTRWVSGPSTKEAPIDLTGLNEAKLQCVVHWSIPSSLSERMVSRPSESIMQCNA